MHNILIIGGAGFIGASLVNKFINNFYTVFVYELPNVDISKLEYCKKNINIFFGELSDYERITKIIESNSIDIVFHLASTLLPSSSFSEYLKEFDSIILPTIKLLPILSSKNVQFVYFSSGGTIYGADSNISGNRESDKTMPISYYGQSKLILEESILFEHRVSNLNYLIIRPSNPYGPGQNLAGKQGLIAISIGKILREESLQVWGNGEVVRDYLFIEDLSHCVCLLISKGVQNEIFNVGSGIGYSVNEIILNLKQITKLDFNIEYTQKRIEDVSFLVLNISKLRDYLGFNPMTLNEGIDLFFNYAINKK